MTTSPAEGAKRALPLSGATIIPFPLHRTSPSFASLQGFLPGSRIYHRQISRTGTIINTDCLTTRCPHGRIAFTDCLIHFDNDPPTELYDFPSSDLTLLTT